LRGGSRRNASNQGGELVSVIRNVLIGLLLCGFAVHGIASDTKLFRYEGSTYSADQASPKLRTLLYDLDLQYYEQRQALADEVLFELYIETEAGKRGVTTAALAGELLDIQPAHEDDLRTFYEANAARINQPYEQVRERIKQHLHEQRLRAAKAKLLVDVKEDGDFELLLAPPESPPPGYCHRGFPA
jgi:DNA-directed RNA polymerase subunit F